MQFGHCLVPKEYSANPKLGPWVSKQRFLYRENTEEKPTSKKAERIRALDGIGFDWGTSKTELTSMWNVRLEQLCEFKAQFGHYLVPKQYSVNPKLGMWVSKQRRNYKLYQEGKPSPMTAERIRELESVGFEFETPVPCFWSVKFEQLCEFKEEFGHWVLPIKYLKLGKWVSKQRSNYRLYQEGKPSTMTADHIRELESVGFEWELISTKWNEQFEQLREFTAQFGHCIVSVKYSASSKLMKWVATQRRNCELYQEGKPSPMTAERIRELKNVGFELKTPNEALWSVKFEQLCEFKQEFGHWVVPIKYSAIPRLGKWVSNQRHNYKLYQEGKSSPLTAERIRELEAVEFK